jgi:hypothetical protein
MMERTKAAIVPMKGMTANTWKTYVWPKMRNSSAVLLLTAEELIGDEGSERARE